MQFASSLHSLERHLPRRPLVLYSGGVDGSYLLRWFVTRGSEPVALTVDLGTGEEDAAERARTLGAEPVRLSAEDEFFRDFLPAAIHAEAFYQGLYPIGSSISRPLYGKVAARVAAERGCDAICHSATALQNSGIRLSTAIAHAAPGLPLAAPFLESATPRPTMVAELAAAGVEFRHGEHSIDANPWARVIECGSLDSPENVLDTEVFEWTCAPDAPEAARPVILDLAFEGGLPVALDGKRMPLGPLVWRLNKLAGTRGVGRFSGLEDTHLWGKNHEIREAPAAAVITTAHRALSNAVFDAREHGLRQTLATAWTDSAVAGGWFDHTTGCIREVLARLDRIVTGAVTLRLVAGTVTVQRLESPHGLYRHRATEAAWPGPPPGGHAGLIVTLAHVDRLRRAVPGSGTEQEQTS
ncbi:argininosuccinate synthase domain-containing protein [Plantactinospora sp. B6F1]|uniref:argininosuccinate synthase domain-containing protein n=1 Tax=Plantactinospora sp. B6F1 TaxID=3158971 RepID=UPI0032D92B3A